MLGSVQFLPAANDVEDDAGRGWQDCFGAFDDNAAPERIGRVRRAVECGRLKRGMTMGDKPDGKRWNWGKAAWIGVALLVLYPLSIGPAARIEWELDAVSGGRDLKIVDAIYAPLWRTASIIGTEELLGGYLALCLPSRMEPLPFGWQ
jgi:hypothetical protein